MYCQPQSHASTPYIIVRTSYICAPQQGLDWNMRRSQSQKCWYSQDVQEFSYTWKCNTHTSSEELNITIMCNKVGWVIKQIIEWDGILVHSFLNYFGRDHHFSGAIHIFCKMTTVQYVGQSTRLRRGAKFTEICSSRCFIHTLDWFKIFTDFAIRKHIQKKRIQLTKYLISSVNLFHN